MAFDLQTLIGGSVADIFTKVVGCFKLSPDKAAELQQALAANAVEVQKIQADLDAKAQDAVTAQVKAASDIIQLEAKSQSWLPRNVRPLLLLLWGIAITSNVFMPVVARYWVPGLTPMPIDPWVYKLTAIGFTGYVSARTVEKVMDKDN